VLFVIFSPNFLFKSHFQTHIIQSFVHAIIFSIIFYLTYVQIELKEKEGATIGTYETNVHDRSYDIEISDQSLANLTPPSKQIAPKTVSYKNEVISSSPISSQSDELTKMPPYDYSKFRNYDYDSMKKKIALLETHQHSNQYFDLVPNFNSTNHETLCAADHGKKQTCCRQPDNYVPDENVCGPLTPYCTDYIHNVQWGKCVANNPHPKPNLGNNVDEIIKTNIVAPDTDNGNVEIRKDGNNNITVSPCPAPPAPAPKCESSTFMVVGGAGTNSMAWSEDGRSWNVTREAGIGPRGLAWNGSIWVAVGSGTNSIAWSEDGKTWNGLGTTVFNGYNGFGRGVAWNGSMWVALGTGNNTIAWSEDGKNWTGLGSSIFSEGFDVAWNGSMWVAVGVPPGGWYSQGKNSIAWSEDGKTWNYINTRNVFGNDGGVKIAWNGSIWVAGGVGGNGGTLAWSEDGKNWTSVTNWQNRGNARCSGLAWNGSMWLATGVGIDGNNTISRSEDGKNWTLVSNTENNGGTDVAWNGSVWVILGNRTNTMAWSNDGENWTGLGRQIFNTYGLVVASKNVLPYTNNWANCS